MACGSAIAVHISRLSMTIPLVRFPHLLAYCCSCSSSWFCLLFTTCLVSILRELARVRCAWRRFAQRWGALVMLPVDEMKNNSSGQITSSLSIVLATEISSAPKQGPVLRYPPRSFHLLAPCPFGCDPRFLFEYCLYIYAYVHIYAKVYYKMRRSLLHICSMHQR